MTMNVIMQVNCRSHSTYSDNEEHDVVPRSLTELIFQAHIPQIGGDR